MTSKKEFETFMHTYHLKLLLSKLKASETASYAVGIQRYYYSRAHHDTKVMFNDAGLITGFTSSLRSRAW